MCQSVEGFEDFVLLVVVTLVFPQTIFGHLHIFFLLEGALIAKAVLMCVYIYNIVHLSLVTRFRARNDDDYDDDDDAKLLSLFINWRYFVCNLRLYIYNRIIHMCL